jgi:hypothetical protein
MIFDDRSCDGGGGRAGQLRHGGGDLWLDSPNHLWLERSQDVASPRAAGAPNIWGRSQLFEVGVRHRDCSRRRFRAAAAVVQGSTRITEIPGLGLL